MEKFRHVPTLLSSDLRPSSVPSPSVGGPHRQETEMAAGTAHSSGKTRTFPTHKRILIKCRERERVNKHEGNGKALGKRSI